MNCKTPNCNSKATAFNEGYCLHCFVSEKYNEPLNNNLQSSRIYLKLPQSILNINVIAPKIFQNGKEPFVIKQYDLFDFITD